MVVFFALPLAFSRLAQLVLAAIPPWQQWIAHHISDASLTIFLRLATVMVIYWFLRRQLGIVRFYSRPNYAQLWLYRKSLTCFVVALIVATILHHHALGFAGILPVIDRALVAPLLEELIFRGLLLTGLQRRLHKWWLSCGISSGLFALGHVSQGLEGMCFALVFGVMACYLVKICQSLWPGAVVHSLINLSFTA